MSWDEWFDRFERAKLGFLHQDRTASGRPSRFSKLVGRETVETRGGRAVKKAVPRRWAKKGARTRRELEEVERRASQTRARPARATATTKRKSKAASARPKRRATTARSR